MYRVLMLLPLAMSAWAYEPGSVSGEYLYYVEGKGKGEQNLVAAPLVNSSVRDKNSISSEKIESLIEKQTELYQKLQEQQSKLLDQNNEIINNQQTMIQFERMKFEEEIKSKNSLINYIGLSKPIDLIKLYSQYGLGGISNVKE